MMMKKITIPAPLIVVIEDVGWWNGFDESALNQPFRTGIGRGHRPEDYKALVKLGRKLGIQIITGFVWCEWDRFNVLKKTPTTTWMAERWNNPEKNNPFFEETIDIINKNLAHIELAFHGVGHEFWGNGIAHRTEFHDLNGNMRDETDIRNHFHAFEAIYQKSGIKAALPEIFIPPALKHSVIIDISKAQKVLPLSPDADLHIKVETKPKDTLRIEGGEVVSIKQTEKFEKLLKIRPLKNTIQLKIDY